MSNIVLFDPNDVTVAGRVTSYLVSVNTPDYEHIVNKLVNPNLSAVSGVEEKYWKVYTSNVIEMNQPEKDAMDTFLEAKTIKPKNFKVLSFNAVYRKDKETWYATDNGDGTYSDKVEETIFTYDSVSTSQLMYKTITVYHVDGTVYSTEKIEYYKNDQNEIIEKKVEE